MDHNTQMSPAAAKTKSAVPVAASAPKAKAVPKTDVAKTVPKAAPKAAPKPKGPKPPRELLALKAVKALKAVALKKVPEPPAPVPEPSADVEPRKRRKARSGTVARRNAKREMKSDVPIFFNKTAADILEKYAPGTRASPRARRVIRLIMEHIAVSYARRARLATIARSGERGIAMRADAELASALSNF